MEELILQLILFIVFVFGPVLLKLLGRRMPTLFNFPQSDSVSVEQEKEIEKEVPKEVEKNKRSPATKIAITTKKMLYKTASLSSIVKEQTQKRKQERELAENIEKTYYSLFLLWERTRDIVGSVHNQGFIYFEQYLKTNYLEKIRVLKEQYSNDKDANLITSSTIIAIEKKIDTFTLHLDLFEKNLQARNASKAKLYNACERYLARILVPYKMSSTYKLSVIPLISPVEELVSTDDITMVYFPEECLFYLHKWPLLPYYLMRTIYSSNLSLEIILTASMGLPESRSANMFFISRGAISKAGIISGWLPWLFADVAASLQAGKLYDAALAQFNDSKMDIEQETLLDSTGKVLSIPISVRRFVIGKVLKYINDYENDFIKTREYVQDDEAELVFSIDSKQKIKVKFSTFKEDLGKLAEALAFVSLKSFQNTSLYEMPGLTLVGEKKSKVILLVKDIENNDFQFEAIDEIVLAASMAIQNNSINTRRIQNTITEKLNKPLNVILSKGQIKTVHKKFSTAARSKDFWVGAAMLSAIAPKKQNKWKYF